MIVCFMNSVLSLWLLLAPFQTLLGSLWLSFGVCLVVLEHLWDPCRTSSGIYLKLDIISKENGRYHADITSLPLYSHGIPGIRGSGIRNCCRTPPPNATGVRMTLVKQTPSNIC